MRRLVLLRHAEAERQATSRRDFDRALTPRGRDDARRIGVWLAEQAIRVDVALVSSALRARETWAEAGAAFSAAAVEDAPSLYEAAPEAMLTLAEAAEGETVAVVAHNPGLQLLAARLAASEGTEPRVRSSLMAGFPPATAAVFRADAQGRWVGEALQSASQLHSAAHA